MTPVCCPYCSRRATMKAKASVYCGAVCEQTGPRAWSVTHYAAVTVQPGELEAMRQDRGSTAMTPTRVRHKKRGTEYEVLGEADLQTEKPLSDYDVVVVYRDVTSGRIWVRPRDEFNDGRFEVVATDV